MAAVLCLYGLKQWGQSSTTFLSDHRQITNYAVFFIALLGLIRAASKRSCILCRIPTAAWLILALFLYAFLSLIWCPDPTKSLEQWGIAGPYIFTIAILAPFLFTDLDDAGVAFTWTLLTGGAICILVLAFGKWGDRGLLLYGDVYESETNPLALASLAGTIFVISALSLRRPNGILKRLFALLCIPISLAVILKSGSRGQLIAGAAGVVVALPIALRIRDVRSIAGLILAVGLILGLGTWGASLVEINADRWKGNLAQKDVADRIAGAQHLLAVANSNVLTSVFGLGNSSSFQVIGYYPHITGLEVVAEEGLVGAAMYLAIILLPIRSIIRITGQRDSTDAQRSSLAMLAGLFTFELILSWKQGTLLSSVYVFLYAIVLARLEEPVGASKAPASAPIETTPGLTGFPNLLR
jgi:O-antigen ligase